LNSPAFSAHVEWNGGEEEAVLSDKLMSKLDELAPKMAKTLFHRMFADSVEQAKMEIRNEITR